MIAVDVDDAKLDLATELGADHVVNAPRPTRWPRSRRSAAPTSRSCWPRRRSSFEQAFRSLRRGGRLVWSPCPVDSDRSTLPIFDDRARAATRSSDPSSAPARTSRRCSRCTRRPHPGHRRDPQARRRQRVLRRGARRPRARPAWSSSSDLQDERQASTRRPSVSSGSADLRTSGRAGSGCRRATSRGGPRRGRRARRRRRRLVHRRRSTRRRRHDRRRDGSTADVVAVRARPPDARDGSASRTGAARPARAGSLDLVRQRADAA